MSTHQPDKELARLLCFGDESAFCLLYARYWQRIKFFCYRFLRSDGSSDIDRAWL